MVNDLRNVKTSALVVEIERRGGRVVFGETAFGLTPKQREVLDFVREQSVRGITPSYAEIADHIGLKSRARVQGIVDGLIERGALRKIPNRRRSLAIVVGQSK